jgi:hypothetical protein
MAPSIKASLAATLAKTRRAGKFWQLNFVEEKESRS